MLESVSRDSLRRVYRIRYVYEIGPDCRPRLSRHGRRGTPRGSESRNAMRKRQTKRAHAKGARGAARTCYVVVYRTPLTGLAPRAGQPRHSFARSTALTAPHGVTARQTCASPGRASAPLSALRCTTRAAPNRTTSPTPSRAACYHARYHACSPPLLPLRRSLIQAAAAPTPSPCSR